MKKQNEQKKEKFKIFEEKIIMKECKFQPNLNDEDEDNNKRLRKVSSCKLVQRLYNDELVKRMEKKENLKKKYRLSFKPKINETSIDMTNKWKKRLGNKKDQKTNKNNISINKYKKIDKKNLNNSAVKLKNKNFNL